MRAFDAILNGKTIDTVFYADSDRISGEEVYRSLVNHDGYDAGIEVREQRARKVRKAPERNLETMNFTHEEQEDREDEGFFLRNLATILYQDGKATGAPGWMHAHIEGLYRIATRLDGIRLDPPVVETR